MAAQPRKEKKSGRVLKGKKEEQKGNHSRISAYRPRTDLTVRASLGLTLHTSAAEEGKSTHKKRKSQEASHHHGSSVLSPSSRFAAKRLACFLSAGSRPSSLALWRTVRKPSDVAEKFGQSTVSFRLMFNMNAEFRRGEKHIGR